MKTPYELNEGIPYIGTSESMKVNSQYKRVKLPSPDFKDTILFRHQKKRLSDCVMWLEPRKDNEANSDLICRITDNTPEQNFSLYSLARINNQGSLRIPFIPDGVNYVKFIGAGNNIEVTKAH